MRVGLWVLRAGLVAMPLVTMPGIYRFAPLPKQLVLQAVAFGLAVCCLTARRLRLPRHSAFVIPLLLYLLVCGVQVLRSLNPSRGLLMLALQVGCATVGLGAASVVAPHQAVSLLRFSAAAGAGVSLLGILEYLGAPFAMLPSAGRPSATFGFRNIAGMYLAINLPLAATLLFGRKRRDWVLGTVAVGSMAAFLIFTRTRGAWLGVAGAVAVGLAVAFWCRESGGGSLAGLLWRRLTPFRRAVGLAVLGVVVGLMWFPPRFQDRNLHRLDEKKIGVGETVASLVRPGGDRGRLRIWQHTLEMVGAHPVGGVGLENWQAFYPLYDRGDVLVLESAPERPHNDFLWIWAELGTVGLLIYVWLLWTTGLQGIGKVRRGERQERMLTLFLGVGMLALLGHSLFSFPRQQAAPSMLFWIALGLVARPDSRLREVGWGFRACVGVGAIAALAGIGICVEAIRFDLHFARALAAQASGPVKAQAAEARRALDRGTFDHRVFLLLGDAKSSLGDHEGAAAVYRDYRDYQPYLPAVYNNLGRAYGAAGAYEEAERAYLRGVEIYPGEGVLLNNLAGVYRARGEVGRALELYRNGGPKDADAYHNLGLLYAEEEMLDQALEAYREALRLDPEMAEVYYSLGGLHLLMGDPASSAAAYETFLERWDGNRTYVRRAKARLVQVYPVLGDACIARGELARAESVYRRLEALGGATAEAYNNLAILYRRRGDREAAQVACRKALETDANFAQAYFTLAGLLDEAGEQEEALSAYRAFLERWPGDDRFTERARSREEALRRGR